jgi:hypothetical protein
MHFIGKKRKKKKEVNGAVLNDTISLLLSLDAQRTGEEEAFFPSFFYPLSLPKPKKSTTQLVPSLTPPRPHAERVMPCRGRGGCAVAAPMPPCPAP